jgi:myo-inositol-1(or 4)-monophosphatase
VSGFVDVALEAALAAADVLRAHFGRVQAVGRKGDVDLVTAADREAEAVIVRHIRQRYPEHRIVAEESGEHPGEADFVWYVDPLDGTTNFVHAFPHFAVSIGLVAHGGLEAGVVIDPLRREVFHAARGRGSFLDDRPIQVSRTATLCDALVGTGFPYDRRDTADRLLLPLGRVLRASRGVRRAGAAALDLAYVACGRMDAYWEARLQPWDTAAGSLLVTEAGGTISALDGSRPVPVFRDILASNGLVHEELRHVVAAADGM